MSELQGNIFGTRIMCLRHWQKKENAFYGNYDGTDEHVINCLWKSLQTDLELLKLTTEGWKYDNHSLEGIYTRVPVSHSSLVKCGQMG